MKKRIQYLYEKGGDNAWYQMMLNAENLSDLLTRAEYTQKLMSRTVRVLKNIPIRSSRWQTWKPVYTGEGRAGGNEAGI